MDRDHYHHPTVSGTASRDSRALSGILRNMRYRTTHDDSMPPQSSYPGQPEERLVLYRSYCRSTQDRTNQYEVAVRGWLYQPYVNRKGKLMIAAIERLVGVPHPSSPHPSSPQTPSRPSSITPGLSSKDDQQLVNIDESPSPKKEDLLSGWMTLRPPLMRATSSFLKGSRSRNASRANSRTASRDPSPDRSERASSLPDIVVTPSKHVDLQGDHADERDRSPGPFGSPDVPTGSNDYYQAAHDVQKATHRATKAAKHMLRERLSAVAHKSLAMRDITITVHSRNDPSHTQTFVTRTDDGGRFSLHCATSFMPGLIHVVSGFTEQETDSVPVPVSGISVISDVDDTIRMTGVTKSKREVLQNVLIRSYDEVALDGVCDWYNQLKASGAHFHYVSNSPWQLYDTIYGFLRHHNFPDGSIHLKRYQGLLDGFMEPAQGRKRAVLESIVQDFPHRKFILVGDSGEADLESYSELARKFPDRILAIYIRDITLPQAEPLLPLQRSMSSNDLIDLAGTPSRRDSLSPTSPSSPNASPPAISPPPLPKRPNMPRRASSRFRQTPASSGGVAGTVFGAMASASSALGSAASVAASKLLAPQLPPRPQSHQGHSRTISAPINSSPTSPLASDRPERPPFGRSISRGSARSSGLSASRPSSRSSSRPASRTSSPDGLDPEVEHVDKRVESWKHRVALHHRTLPSRVHLRTWRDPNDVREDSLRHFHGKDGNSLI